MTNIGETIAKLRHDRSMTQEALAEMLCVSPQTVSKWENSVNLPDVQMLPLIADVFGVRVDALFGREERTEAGNPDRACEDLMEAARRIIAGLDGGSEEPFERWFERYCRMMREDERTRSEVCREQGLVYLREAFGAAALRNPPGGWPELLRSEGVARALALFGDEDFRRAIACVMEHRMRDFTLPFLCERAGVRDAAALEGRIEESCLFQRRELMIDDRAVTFYSAHTNGKIMALLAALAWCAEYDGWQGVYCMYYDDGSLL